MNIIRRPRMGGKTTEIIHRAAEVENSVIVVSDYVHIIYILDYAKNVGLNITKNQIITFQELIDGVRLRGRRCTLFIDNADMLLDKIARPISIDTITITDEEGV